MGPAVDRHPRLDGDFPAGVVDLRFRFTLDGDHLAAPVIEP
jgi:hypothetical protein